MQKEKVYGDEDLGYRILVRDLSPQEARGCLDTNMNDGIYMQMNNNRRVALEQRAIEEK